MRTPGALVFGSRKASLLETWLLHLELVSWDLKKHHARMCFRTMALGCREASPLEAQLLPGVIVQKHHHTGNWTRTRPKFSSPLLLPDPGRQWVAALYIMIIVSNFRETKCSFRELKKKNFREGFQHNTHGFRNQNSLQGSLDRSYTPCECTYTPACMHVSICIPVSYASIKSAGLPACFVDVLVIHLAIALSSRIIASSTDVCFRCSTPFLPPPHHVYTIV